MFTFCTTDIFMAKSKVRGTGSDGGVLTQYQGARPVDQSLQIWSKAFHWGCNGFFNSENRQIIR